MILVDSLYINNSGGKILLDYLVKELEKLSNNYFYLFDERCRKDFNEIPSDRKIFLPASLFKRHNFYQQNKSKFTKVFCFGNLPPTIRLKVPVYTYFHQRIYLDLPKGLNLKGKIIFSVKSYIFQLLAKNTDLFIVQSDSMKVDLLKKISIHTKETVLVLPFYEKLNYPIETSRYQNRLIYVSGGSVHKNHSRLLEAFKNAYDALEKGELVLTIDKKFTVLYNEIEELNKKGYPIYNLGFINKDQLAMEYAKAEFCIFPSLSESFGLGIVEGIEAGCKIIGADLPFMKTACDPSISFDPLEISSIENAIKKAFTEELPPTKQKIHNNISSLINLLKN